MIERIAAMRAFQEVYEQSLRHDLKWMEFTQLESPYARLLLALNSSHRIPSQLHFESLRLAVQDWIREVGVLDEVYPRAFAQACWHRFAWPFAEPSDTDCSESENWKTVQRAAEVSRRALIRSLARLTVNDPEVGKSGDIETLIIRSRELAWLSGEVLAVASWLVETCSGESASLERSRIRYGSWRLTLLSRVRRLGNFSFREGLRRLNGVLIALRALLPRKPVHIATRLLGPSYRIVVEWSVRTSLGALIPAPPPIQLPISAPKIEGFASLEGSGIRVCSFGTGLMADRRLAVLVSGASASTRQHVVPQDAGQFWEGGSGRGFQLADWGDRARQRKVRRLTCRVEACFYPFALGSSNYYHLLVEGLGALAKYVRGVPESIGVDVLLPRWLPQPIQFFTLALAKHYGGRTILIDEWTELPSKTVISLPDAPSITWEMDMSHIEVLGRSLNPETVRLLRDDLVEALGLNSMSFAGSRRIVKRSSDRYAGWTTTVVEPLTSAGFRSFRPEDLPAIAQARAFRESSLLAAESGAALANLVFCLPGTRVLLASARSSTLFEELCQALDLEVFSIKADPGSPHSQRTCLGLKAEAYLNFAGLHLDEPMAAQVVSAFLQNHC